MVSFDELRRIIGNYAEQYRTLNVIEQEKMNQRVKEVIETETSSELQREALYMIYQIRRGED